MLLWGTGYGLSGLEIILVVGIGAIIWSPQSVVKNSRMAGRYVGRAIGYGSESMKQFNQFISETQLKQLHTEMQSTLGELRNLGREIQGGIPFNSARVEPTPVSPYPKRPTVQKDEQVITQQQLQQQQSEKQQYAKQEDQVQNRQEGEVLHSQDQIDEFNKKQQFPISAVRTGIIKENSRTGSQILLDSWMEEEVAWRAKEMFDQFQDKIEK
eukprot:TRINITY_DN16218_c0_g1_i5.p2 TRINITY_DN16218_c0_g1~~TRINITY_DN16218_c0_g1_i5.p2  ORF type:complete len:212 (+),score=24.66 TRINITY_DN16218_c0_g1_i5:175-810(+)